MRNALLAAVLLSAACSFSPDVKPYRPKSAADCPGQKACGYRCVVADDPAAGCTADTCEPCPSGPAHAAPYCNGLSACALACAVGYYPPTGDAADGCQPVAAADAANCGSPGHACGAGEACAGGLCAPADVQTGGGTAMRGLAVLAPDTYAWTTDPQVAGGVSARGTLHRVVDGAPAADLTGLGHATWVHPASAPRAAGEENLVIVAGSQRDTDGSEWVGGFVADLRTDTAARWTGGDLGEKVLGVAIRDGWWLSAVTPATADGLNNMLFWEALDPEISSSADIFWDPPLTGMGEGAGFFWIGATDRVQRIESLGPPPDGGFDYVLDGGLWFTGMVASPRPDRIAARAGPTPDDPIEVYLLDLRDGSVWMGLTVGGDARPWRLVRGDGVRTQMDIAADDRAVVWSDYDKGEVWEYVSDSGAPPFLLARGKPWAISLTADRVYWTDTAAQAIRSVAR